MPRKNAQRKTIGDSEAKRKKGKKPGLPIAVIDRFLPDMQNLLDLAIDRSKKEQGGFSQIKIDIFEPRIADLADQMLLSLAPIVQSLTGDLVFQQEIWHHARSHVHLDFDEVYFALAECSGPNVSDLAARFASHLRQHLRRQLREHLTMACRSALESAKADMLPTIQNLLTTADKAFEAHLYEPRPRPSGRRAKKLRRSGIRKRPQAKVIH